MPLIPLIISPGNNARVPTVNATVHGQTQKGNTIFAYMLNGALIGKGTAASDGSFAVNIVLPMEGQNQITLRAIALNGSTSPFTAPLTLFVDSFPSAASTPQAVAGDTIITLTWSPNPENDIAGYHLYRDGSDTPINRTIISANPPLQFRDIGLTDGRPYIYRLSAVDTVGQIGAQSNSVTATPLAGISWK